MVYLCRISVLRMYVCVDLLCSSWAVGDTLWMGLPWFSFDPLGHVKMERTILEVACISAIVQVLVDMLMAREKVA